MNTFVKWDWLIATLRRTSLLRLALQRDRVTRLTFTTPAGEKIEVPEGSELTIWMD